MQDSQVGGVEKKVLGALIMMANKEMVATASNTTIAKRIGYKASGGIITYALRMLEMKNFIAPMGNNQYKVLL
jgi:deoxyribose-phosphate aldolase